MKTQLLATFCKRNRLYETIDLIIACNDIVFDKVYVFQNENDYHQLICTYNVEATDDYVESSVDTISIHRKKQSNSLYTINALNELVKKLNNGVLDNSFPMSVSSPKVPEIEAFEFIVVWSSKPVSYTHLTLPTKRIV